jgi:hypothetical protein
MQVLKTGILNPKELQGIAQEIISFTAEKYSGDGAINALVVLVEEERWWDLYLDVVPKTELVETEYSTPIRWQKWTAEVDGFSFAFQKAVVKGVVDGPVPVVFRDILPLTSLDERREAARKIIGDFDDEVAERAAGYNAVIFLNHDLILKRKTTVNNYPALVIAHECINIIEETTGQTLIEGHDANILFDAPTLETYREFQQKIGEDTLKQLYPTLF